MPWPHASVNPATKMLNLPNHQNPEIHIKEETSSKWSWPLHKKKLTLNI